jgi:hypothetical protein
MERVASFPKQHHFKRRRLELEGDSGFKEAAESIFEGPIPIEAVFAGRVHRNHSVPHATGREYELIRDEFTSRLTQPIGERSLWSDETQESTFTNNDTEWRITENIWTL